MRYWRSVADLKPMSCGVFTGSGSGRSSPSHFVSPPVAEALRAANNKQSASAPEIESGKSWPLVLIFMCSSSFASPGPDRRRGEDVVGHLGRARELPVHQVLGLELQRLPEADVHAARDPVDEDRHEIGVLGVSLLIPRVERDAERIDRER